MIDFTCQDKTPQLCMQARQMVAESKIAIIGVGALGTVASELLVRAGAENIMLYDDDRVDATNLVRQTLYVSDDIGKKKVVCAKRRLESIRKDITVEIFDKRLSLDDSDAFTADIVLDCTDSIASRLIIDEICSKKQIAWVHAAAIGVIGEVMVMTKESIKYSDFISGKKVEKGCEDEGVLGITTTMVATLQTSFALRLLIGKVDELKNVLFRVNAWRGSIDRFRVKK